MSTHWCEFRAFRPEEKEGKTYLIYLPSSGECNDIIGLEGRAEGHLENHISPDGKHILVCTEGLKINKFTHSGNDIVIKPTEWTIPLRTDDMDRVELASQVKFESNSVIRFLTRDKRDILYRLDSDEQIVHYIGEVKVDN